MPSPVINGYIPTRAEETGNRSHRAFCPATGAIEWFRNRTVYRAFLWLTSRPDIAYLQPNAYTIKKRFGNQRKFNFEFRVRYWDGREELVAVRTAKNLIQGDTGEWVPPYWDAASQYCVRHGLLHSFLTDDHLAHFRQRIDNWQRILPYLQLASQVPEPELDKAIRELIRGSSTLSLAELVGAIPGYPSQAVISHTCNSLWRGEIVADLDREDWSVNTLFSERASSKDEAPTIKTPCPSTNKRTALPDPEDPDTWENIPADCIGDADKRRSYQQRRAIVWARLKDGKGVAVIARAQGCTEAWVTKVVKRCQRLKPNGEPWGWEGAIPNARWPWQPEIPRARSTDGSMSAKGHALTRLFQHYPSIQSVVIDTALPKKERKSKRRSGRRRVKIKAVWKAFLKACEAEAIPSTNWPFNTKDQGYEAIRRFTKRLLESHTRRYIEVHVGQDGLVVWQATQPNHDIEPIVRPYDLFQIDGHDSNGYASISVPDMVGLPCVLPLGRFWLILCMDVGSRAAMGGTITPELNYASVDLLDCLFNALVPWERYQGILPDSSYRPGAGMPSGVWPFCAWRGVSCIQMDNALSHLSRQTQERIVETLGATVVTGIPGQKTSNAIAERYFSSFESTFGYGPTSTGSDPNDVRREDPVGAAVRHRIELFMLEALADSVLANYNATPHTALNGRTPLQYLRDWHQRDPLLARYVPDPIQDDLPLYYRTFTATIARNEKQGGRCYVEWLYERHTNDTLAARPSLTGTKVRLVVDSRDARRLWAYTLNGEPLGQLEPQSRWALRKHTLRERRIIGAFQRANLIDTDTTDPVGDLHAVIEAQAQTDTHARRKLAVQRRRKARETESPPPRSPADAASATDQHPTPRGWVPITGHFHK